MDSQPMPPFFPMDAEELNIDFIGNLMNMDPSAMGQQSAAMNPSLMLEQQFKLAQLQQLQQLQNQIFQQQIALISGTSIADPTQLPAPQRQDCGLPTPGPSAELRAQQQPIEYVSPMILDYLDVSANNQSAYRPPTYRGSTSAPAHIAFSTNPSPHSAVTSPDVDLDISPLTSPWLGADHYSQQHQSQQQQQHHQQQQQIPMPPMSRHNKRPATPNTEDDHARKRQSPAIHPSNPVPHTFASTSPNFAPTTTTTATAKRRATKSASSTPLIRSTRSRRDAANGPTIPGMPVHDSPSPVDMPPPAAPAPSLDRGTKSTEQHQQQQQQIKPVTPAMMMNLGRLRSDSAPHSVGVGSGGVVVHNALNSPVLPATATNDRKGKGRGTVAGDEDNGTTSTPTTKKPTKRGMANGNASTLKTILPAGPMPTHANSNSNPHANGITTSSNHNSNTTSTSILSPSSTIIPPQIRKTSHKAAEQKRRDSLKTTFDDLRLLLPPIPLSSDNKDNTDEPLTPIALFPPRPLLPGALPPRGPPKAGGEGPNKGVSKLQLLMCGNEYIRVLKARVDRRDKEIGDLREEIRRLRGVVISGAGVEEGEGALYGVGEDGTPIDLEKDLDACELYARPTVLASVSEGGGTGDDDEEG